MNSHWTRTTNEETGRGHEGQARHLVAGARTKARRTDGENRSRIQASGGAGGRTRGLLHPFSDRWRVYNAHSRDVLIWSTLLLCIWFVAQESWLDGAIALQWNFSPLSL